MGVVYRAFDPVLQRHIALKLLRPERSANPNSRLIREAQAMAKVSDPSVVQVYDTGVVDGNVFIAMELIDGMTLSRWLRVAARTWNEILDQFLAAGHGLAKAHAANLIHRDFKPSNVLVSKTGRVLVGDFGLATPIDRADIGSHPSASGGDSVENYEALHTITLTKAGQGTPRYMAPEQREGRVALPSADQYSFCVALSEALRERSVPEPVLACVRRGLAISPAARFASMDELLIALHLARSPVAIPTRSRVALRWVAASAAAVATLALIALIGNVSAESKDPELAPAKPTAAAAELPTGNLEPTPTATLLTSPPVTSVAARQTPLAVERPTHTAPTIANKARKPKRKRHRSKQAVNKPRAAAQAPQPLPAKAAVPDDLIRELWTTK